MNIGIWGTGIVGSATGKVLEQAHKVYYYDRFKKDPKLSIDKELVDNCQIIFITVPTPMLQSGRIGIRDIKDSLIQIQRLTKSCKIIVIKSTVTPDTTKRFARRFPQFNFAHNPEFLRAKYAYEDMLNSKRIVIGVDKDETFQALEKIYQEVFKEVPIIKTTFEEAEIVKYASNILLAGQIALANELYQICRQLRIDYKIVERVLGYDKRIGTNIKMPGLDGKLGFGGVCFPKDLNAMIYKAREAGYRPYLLEEIWRLNLRVRNKEVK